MSRDPGTQPLPALSVRRFSTSAWRAVGSGLRGDREICSFRKTQHRENPYSKPAFTKTGLNPSGPERDRPWPLRRYQLWHVSLKFWCQKKAGDVEVRNRAVAFLFWPGDCLPGLLGIVWHVVMMQNRPPTQPYYFSKSSLENFCLNLKSLLAQPLLPPTPLGNHCWISCLRQNPTMTASKKTALALIKHPSHIPVSVLCCLRKTKENFMHSLLQRGLHEKAGLCRIS